MLSVTYTLNFVLMIALPIALGIFVVRKFGTPWSLLLWGALAFIASQAVRLPLLFGLTALFQIGVLPHIPQAFAASFNLVVLCLTAGLFEEGARYLVYRLAIPSARRWADGVTFGAGHGGIEAIILGVLAGLSFASLAAMRGVDLATLPIPVEQQALAAKQISEFWSAPWYLTVLGAVERTLALGLHVTLSVMVLQSFTRRNLGWLFAAMGWHALANMVAVGMLPVAGPRASEGALAVIVLASLALLFYLRRGEPAPSVEPSPAPAPARQPTLESADDLAHQIDDSRFAS